MTSDQYAIVFQIIVDKKSTGILFSDLQEECAKLGITIDEAFSEVMALAGYGIGESSTGDDKGKLYPCWDVSGAENYCELLKLPLDFDTKKEKRALEDNWTSYGG